VGQRCTTILACLLWQRDYSAHLDVYDDALPSPELQFISNQTVQKNKIVPITKRFAIGIVGLGRVKRSRVPVTTVGDGSSKTS
jgi:hypothetical protein